MFVRRCCIKHNTKSNFTLVVVIDNQGEFFTYSKQRNWWIIIQQLHNKVESRIQQDSIQFILYIQTTNLKKVCYWSMLKKLVHSNRGAWYCFCKPYPSCCKVTESSQVKPVFSLPFWIVIFSGVTVSFKSRYLFAMPSFPKYVFWIFASLFALLSPMSSPLTVMPSIKRKHQCSM